MMKKIIKTTFIFPRWYVPLKRRTVPLLERNIPTLHG